MLYYKRLYCFFFQLWWRNKSFSLVFKSNRLRFCLYKLPASENNFQNTQQMIVQRDTSLQSWQDVGMFNFYQFKTVSSSVYAFKFSLSKNPFNSASFFSSTEFCCSSSYVAFDYVLNKEQLVENLYGFKFREGCGFAFSGGNLRESTL